MMLQVLTANLQQLNYDIFNMHCFIMNFSLFCWWLVDCDKSYIFSTNLVLQCQIFVDFFTLFLVNLWPILLKLCSNESSQKGVWHLCKGRVLVCVDFLLIWTESATNMQIKYKKLTIHFYCLKFIVSLLCSYKISAWLYFSCIKDIILYTWNTMLRMLVL